jgi:chromosome segregation ATPase
VSCASNNEVKDIKNMLSVNNDEVSKIKSRIDSVTIQLEDDKKKLESLERADEGLSSRAIKLRNSIDRKETLLERLESKIGIIEYKVENNKDEIEAIKVSQSKTKKAMVDALEKNHEIRINTHNGLADIEKEYQERRNKRREGVQEK